MADAAEVLRQRAPSLQRLLVLCLLNLLLAALVGWQWQRGGAAQGPVLVVEPVAQPLVAVVPEPVPSPAPTVAPLAVAPDVPSPAVPEPEPMVQSVSEPIAVATAHGYGINVGLFADPANAQRALVRIRQAGVQARSDTLQLERGPRVRVRAGPFGSRAQAEQAAARIQALGLDAQVFKQGASE